MVTVINSGEFKEVEDEDVDYELMSPARQFSTHVNMIPIQSAVQVPRHFYGARFFNQAMPVKDPESPLVQNLDTSDDEGLSFDQKAGRHAGALFADDAGQVTRLTNDDIHVRLADGTDKKYDLYNNFSFNRKSVTGDTEIAIRKPGGSLWIGKIKDYEFHEGDLTASYDPRTSRSAWMPVRSKLTHPNDKQLLKVTFMSGRSVVVTEDHSLLTLDHTGIIPVLPGDCTPGVTRSPVVLLGQYEPSLPVCGKEVDLGYLAGLYLSEGHLPKQPGLISIAVLPAQRKEEVNSLISRLGFRPHRNKYGKASFTSHKLSRWLHDNCGSGAGNKFISNALLSRGQDFRLAMLQGYMSGDGCLWSDGNGAVHLQAVTTSEKLRSDLTWLLSSLGIFVSWFGMENSARSDKWSDGYGLRITSGHIDKLPRWFFYQDRHDKINRLRKYYYRASTYEMVPTYEESWDYLRSELPAELPIAYYQAKYSQRFSKRKLSIGNGMYGRFGRSDIMWDAVDIIEHHPHEEIVYDLSVETSETFAVCGGLMVHNSSINSTPRVKVGDPVTKGQILAKSNFTNDDGELAMGLNARIGVVPYKGYSMDDAIVLSERFANKLQSEHSDTHELERDRDTKTGLGHFRSLFPEKFTKKQLELLDDEGVVKPGTILQQGDPMILSTRPRVLSSGGAASGKLTKSMSQARSDASQIWDSEYPAEVVDVFHNKKNIKVITKSYSPTRLGDKLTIRSGAKAIVSKLVPDDRMPHTEDGQPLDVLLNPLSLYSRSNMSLPYELLLGKVAAKTGQRQRIPGFTKPGEKWKDIIKPLLEQNGLTDKERVFDPGENRFLDNPVMVGNAYIMKLHHEAAGKLSARGQGSYDQWEQPTKGPGPGGKSKRLSGLESQAMLSSGAYANLREGSTLRGSKSDDYWRDLRTGKIPKKPGVPFAWEKAMNMLRGAGIDPKEVGPGKLRLGPMRDETLNLLRPVEIKSGDLLNLGTLAPVEGGLFDKAIVGNNGWGQISLPYKVPNPAYEDALRTLLGLKKQEMEDILRGRMELPEHLR